MQKDSRIGVVYLCRVTEDLQSFVTFVNSYEAFSSNCDHELIIIFKGFEGDLKDELNQVQPIFEKLKYRPIYLSDESFDIGAYLSVAKTVHHEYLLFFNSHVAIAADNWLHNLVKTIDKPGVGLVGTTASYESVFSSNCVIHTFADLYFKKKFQKDLYVLNYYKWIIEAIDPNNDVVKQYRRYIKSSIKSFFKKLFKKDKSCLEIPESIVAQEKLFGRFPNPHIRSNGFIISRELFLEVASGYNLSTKEGTCAFESGPNGFSRNVRALGLKTLLVGKNGVAFDVKDWPKSETFRMDDQGNLMITDNHTRNYDNYSNEERLVHSWFSWGDDCIKFKPRFPHFNFKLNTKSLIASLVDEEE